MADDFKKKFETLSDKLKIDPKKDSDLKKALTEVSTGLKKEGDGFDKTLKSLVSVLGKKKKDAKDKDEKKAIEQLEALASEDVTKRYTFKDNSTAPS